MSGRQHAVSREFGDVLFARHPEWTQLREFRRNEDGTDYFTIHVPRPIPDDCVGGLTISTGDSEITIECGQHWHTHRGPPWSDVMSYIQAILDEELVFVRMMHDQRVLGARCVDADTARRLIDEGPKLAATWNSRLVPDRLNLWSWLGTYDAELS